MLPLNKGSFYSGQMIEKELLQRATYLHNIRCICFVFDIPFYHILPNRADVFAFVLIFKFELEQREAESKG